MKSTITSQEIEVVNANTGPFFRMTENTVLGGIRGMQQEKTSVFKVYEIIFFFFFLILILRYTITLFDTNTVFENRRSPWNREYPAAQQIFGDGASCRLARLSIRAMHSNVYRRGIIFFFFLLFPFLFFASHFF